MERITEQLRERAARAQAAIVRTLLEELKHLPPESGAAADLRMQLAEERERLALCDKAMHKAEVTKWQAH